MNFANFIKYIKPYLWRLIFTVAGFATAMSFIVYGAELTIFVLICCAIGYLIGALHDKNISLISLLRDWRNRR